MSPKLHFILLIVTNSEMLENERVLWSCSKFNYTDDELCRSVLYNEYRRIEDQRWRYPYRLKLHKTLVGHACMKGDVQKINRYLSLMPSQALEGRFFKDILLRSVRNDMFEVYNVLMNSPYIINKHAMTSLDAELGYNMAQVCPLVFLRFIRAWTDNVPCNFHRNLQRLKFSLLGNQHSAIEEIINEISDEFWLLDHVECDCSECECHFVDCVSKGNKDEDMESVESEEKDAPSAIMMIASLCAEKIINSAQISRYFSPNIEESFTFIQNANEPHEEEKFLSFENHYDVDVVRDFIDDLLHTGIDSDSTSFYPEEGLRVMVSARCKWPPYLVLELAIRSQNDFWARELIRKGEAPLPCICMAVAMHGSKPMFDELLPG